MTRSNSGKRIPARVLASVIALVAFLPAGAVIAEGAPTGQSGVATWHDPSDCDCQTASKHPWDGTELIAAHRTLPLGSKVRVVNLSNGKTVVVRIMDRGPYIHGRVIDVSRSAARVLGLLETGIARVRLEPLPPGGV